MSVPHKPPPGTAIVPAAADPDAMSDVPDFTPVPRKNALSHGWTPAKQKEFMRMLTITGSVRQAAEGVGMSHCGVYQLRHAPGGQSFARAWDIAVGVGARRIRDVLIDQAIHGTPETVVMGGQRVERRKFNHRTMQWALSHHMPDDYPGGSTFARKQKPMMETDKSREIVLKQLNRLIAAAKEERVKAYADDPAKRAAYELLYPDDDFDWGGAEEPVDAEWREVDDPPQHGEGDRA